MNIKEAKEEVKNTVKAYLTRDVLGEYRIPVNRQRPLFLIGPPGIGKTDIMAQVTEEMDIALVAYSMTHHTRQSALGLPYIKNQEYGGNEYRTTEYTMSEIIASVYDAMEETGKTEGILFLDEINCISETLAPSMLQFLQTKTFGKHKVPQGWVIITAGNPPEYNDSVREFDIATTDRLKTISIEPDFESWKEYASNNGTHGAIMTYLEVHPDDFYSISTQIDGREFVTARGWIDLSEMMNIYEAENLPVNLRLIDQYVHDERIARDFAIIYDMFFRYQSEYHILDILKGEDLPDVVRKARRSRFDERLIVIQQFIDALSSRFQNIYLTGNCLSRVLTLIKENKESLSNDAGDAADILRKLEKKERKNNPMLSGLTKFLDANASSDETADKLIMQYISPIQQSYKSDVSISSESLKNAFGFMEKAYSGDKEMFLFVSGLSKNRFCADFIMKFGSDEYLENSKQLKMDQRELEIINEINNLN